MAGLFANIIPPGIDIDHVVARSMHVDFIYFDLMLTALWIAMLVRQKRTRAQVFGLVGFAIVFLADDVLWYHIQGTRTIMGPIQPDLFLLYFSFTYGVIMFSYAPIMFDRSVGAGEKIFWTALMYGGWLLIAMGSQKIPLDDRVMAIGRDMSGGRIVQVIMAAGGYLALIALKALRWKRMADPWWFPAYLFLIGILVHFAMESTLWIAGIRPARWDILLFNSLVEFNTGVPILYFVWVLLPRKKDRDRKA